MGVVLKSVYLVGMVDRDGVGSGGSGIQRQEVRCEESH